MTQPNIVRVWGRADSSDIELNRGTDSQWHCTVPPDMQDGQYAVELWAVNDLHETAYWTGVLYMSGGVCCLHINSQQYVLTLLPDNTCAELLNQHFAINIGRCGHG